MRNYKEENVMNEEIKDITVFRYTNKIKKLIKRII